MKCQVAITPFTGISMERHGVVLVMKEAPEENDHAS
jgi:hypothetical protein